MSNFTEKAIKETFMQLLDEKPLHQITVKDIVGACGINRNTFYYHFPDIPTLLQEIVVEQAESIMEAYPTIESAEKGMEVAVLFALQNKRAVLHIFNSGNRDIFEQNLMNVCEHVVNSYINIVLGDKPVKETDKDILINYYKCTCFGHIIDWINKGMEADIVQSFNRLCELRKGMIEEMILRSIEE